MNEQLPDGWVEVTLSDVCTKPQYGWTSKAGKEGKIKYLRTTDISNGDLNWETVPFCIEEPDNIDKYQVRKNDILVSRAGSVGLSFRITEDVTFPAAFASYLIRFQPTQVALPKLVEYFLQSNAYWDQISDFSSGIAIPNINGSKLETLVLPLPPLAEQARVVLALDRLMARVQSAQEQLATVPKLLKRFRQSVLSAAVSGKLTEDWREGEKGDWVETTLIEVVKEKPRNGFSPQPANHVTKTLSLTLSATTSGTFNPKHFKYIDATIPLDSHLWLKKGDILIQRANSLDFVGTAAIYDQADYKFIYPDLMMKVTANSKILPQFLLYSLSNEDVRKYFRENATGTTGNMPKINQGVVMNTPISLPPISEQNEIVARVSNLWDWADKLEASYKLAKRQLDALPAGILAKAFAGELTEQDPTDEPAQVLLERIRAERLQQPKESKPKRVPIEATAAKQRKKMAEQLRSIKEILGNTNAPVPADTVWKQSVHKDDIEAFYADLKQLVDVEGSVADVKEDGQSYLKLTHAD